MTAVLKFLLGLLFIGLVPVFAVCLSLRLSPLSAESIKQTLKDSGVYVSASQRLLDTVNASLKSNPKDNPVTLVAPIVKKEITPAYIEMKLERIIDDTSGWITGLSTTPPSLSLVDLKEKLLKQNGKIVAQLESFEKSYAEKKPELEAALKEAQKEDPTLSATNLPDVNISQYLKKDPIIPLGNYLGWLKIVYFLTHTGLLILSVGLISLIVLIILINPQVKSATASLTALFLIAALWNYGLFLSTARLVPLVLSRIPTTVANFDLTSFIPAALYTPLLESITTISPLVSYVLLGMGLLALVMNWFQKTPKSTH